MNKLTPLNLPSRSFDNFDSINNDTNDCISLSTAYLSTLTFTPSQYTLSLLYSFVAFYKSLQLSRLDRNRLNSEICGLIFELTRGGHAKNRMQKCLDAAMELMEELRNSVDGLVNGADERIGRGLLIGIGEALWEMKRAVEEMEKDSGELGAKVGVLLWSCDEWEELREGKEAMEEIMQGKIGGEKLDMTAACRDLVRKVTEFAGKRRLQKMTRQETVALQNLIKAAKDVATIL